MPDSFLHGSPGHSIAELIENGSESLIRVAIGDRTVDLLRALDKKFADPAALRAAVAKLVDPAGILRDDAFRSAVVGALPIAKARELAGRLSMTSGRDVYDALSRHDFGRTASRDELKDFFGIDDEVAGKAVADGEAKPSYGLFDHQRRAALDVALALDEHPRKVLLHMPTGAGKTRTAMHVVARHFNARERAVVCWLAQSRELLEQAADEFEACWRHLGTHAVRVVRCWGGGSPPADFEAATFLVAGFAKLHASSTRDRGAMLRLADETTLVVVDEAHQAVAPTYRRTIETLSRKRPDGALLGLSATPGRTWADAELDRELSAFFGGRKVMIRMGAHANPVPALVDAGYLARPTFRTLNVGPGLSLSEEDRRALAAGLEVPESVLDALAVDGTRNLRILAEVEALSRRHRRTIVFAATVAHARTLCVVANVRGIPSFVVTGDMPLAERERAIRMFRGDDPRAMAMFNFGVLTTGFDAPRTSAAVVARPTRSLVLYSQMVGRAIRGVRAGGNAEAEIVTVVDPALAGFGDMAAAFTNWEDVWDDEG